MGKIFYKCSVESKISIIGSGIIGLSCAYFIYKKGYKNITVIDKMPYPAAECTYQNGCQLSYSDVGPLSSLSNIIKGVKWLGQDDAPLLIRPSFKDGQLPFLLKYAINALPYKKRNNIREILKLGFETKKLFVEEKFPFKFEHKKTGIYHLYSNRMDYQHDLKRCSDNSLYNNATIEATSEKDFKLANPSVKKGIYGAIHHPHDEIGNSRIFCVELRKFLESKGVNFIFNEEYNLKQQSTNEKLVIAAGSNSYNLAKDIGIRLPIYPVKGYSITVPIGDNDCIKGSLMDEDTKIVYTRLGNRLRAAGTGEFNGFNYDITPCRIKLLKNETLKLFPQLEANMSEAEEWACLRPFTPNGQPIIKEIKNNVYIASGNGFLGWTQSLVTGKKLSELL